MNRLEFYLGKAKFLSAFAWWREWRLFRDEWKMTYKEAREAEEDIDRIMEDAIARLCKAAGIEVPEELNAQDIDKQ